MSTFFLLQVMVMSGQRAVMARNEAQEAKKRFDKNYENSHSHSDEKQQQFSDYADDEDYEMDDDDDERAFVTTTTTEKSHKRIRMYKNDKRHKSKASSTIGAKLQNLQLIRSSM